MKASEQVELGKIPLGGWFDFDGERCKRTGNGYEYIDEMIAKDWHKKQLVTPLPECTGWSWQPGDEKQPSPNVMRCALCEGAGTTTFRETGEEDTSPVQVQPKPYAVRDVNDSFCFHYFVLEPVVPPAATQEQPLQVREGGWYRRRDGLVVGPAKPIHNPGGCYQWSVGGEDYTDSGNYWASGAEERRDLTEEVPPPSDQIYVVTTCKEGDIIAEHMEPAASVPPPEQPGEAQPPEPDTAPLMIEPDRAEEVRHVKDGYIVGERLHVLMPGNVDAPQPVTVDPGEGWRLLAKDEEVLEGDECWHSGRWNLSSNWKCCDGRQDDFPYRRRVEPQPEPEPTYRPFRSAEEFKVHRDRWVRRVAGNGAFKFDAYGDDGVVFGSVCKTFEHCLETYRFDDDGTPCGVKVSP